MADSGDSQRTDTQNRMVLHHLLHIGPLTPLEALNRYGVFRLGARRYDLIKKGWDVRTEMVTRNGKRFAEYSIPLPKGQISLFQMKTAGGANLPAV
jgi:hypothetical protein